MYILQCFTKPKTQCDTSHKKSLST